MNFISLSSDQVFIAGSLAAATAYSVLSTNSNSLKSTFNAFVGGVSLAVATNIIIALGSFFAAVNLNDSHLNSQFNVLFGIGALVSTYCIPDSGALTSSVYAGFSLTHMFYHFMTAQ